nr:hypothetical protein [Neobacillus niacini]
MGLPINTLYQKGIGLLNKLSIDSIVRLRAIIAQQTGLGLNMQQSAKRTRDKQNFQMD